jgi:hypothetical protein
MLQLHAQTPEIHDISIHTQTYIHTHTHILYQREAYARAAVPLQELAPTLKMAGVQEV